MGRAGNVALKKPSTLLALGSVFSTVPPYNYSAEYQAVLNKAIVSGYALPSPNQRILQDNLMRAWITSGAYAKADLIYVLANDAGLNFGRINWKDPNSFLLTDVGADPVRFMSNYGAYTNTESVAFGALDTLWMPSIGVKFLLNDNCLVSSTQSYYGAGGGMSYRSAATGDQCTFYALDVARVFLNNSTLTASTATIHNFFNLMNRRNGATACQIVYNNAGVATANISSANASGTRNALRLGVLGDIHNAISTLALGNPMEALFVGGGLADAEFISYDVALTTYLSAIRYVTGLFASGNYTVPAGITQILVECWGAGGSGRGYPNAAQTTTGGGGGGGAYAASLINVTPGQIIPFVIGAGGVGGVGVGAAGGDTSWNGGVILAKGGQGAPLSSSKAAGGLASASVGTTKYNGGSGGAGGGALATSVGSGGSAAGLLGDGITGVDAASTASSTRGYYKLFGGGPPGYSFGNTSDLNGVPGMLGSGGGGARRTTVTKNGGNGGAGFIRISASKSY